MKYFYGVMLAVALTTSLLFTYYSFQILMPITSLTENGAMALKITTPQLTLLNMIAARISAA
jgi:hypothetical protein